MLLGVNERAYVSLNAVDRRCYLPVAIRRLPQRAIGLFHERLSAKRLTTHSELPCVERYQTDLIVARA
jgi:hypothetical protein